MADSHDALPHSLAMPFLFFFFFLSFQDIPLSGWLRDGRKGEECLEERGRGSGFRFLFFFSRGVCVFCLSEEVDSLERDLVFESCR